MLDFEQIIRNDIFIFKRFRGLRCEEQTVGRKRTEEQEQEGGSWYDGDDLKFVEERNGKTQDMCNIRTNVIVFQL